MMRIVGTTGREEVTLVYIAELEENRIGSNCGQYVLRHLQAGQGIAGGYDYCDGVTSEAIEA